MSHLVKQITLESFQKDYEAIKELIELRFLKEIRNGSKEDWREQQRIAKEEIETGVEQTTTGIDEDQKVLDDVLKTFHFLRSTEKQVRKH
jgi:hypothetical protein